MGKKYRVEVDTEATCKYLGYLSKLSQLSENAAVNLGREYQRAVDVIADMPTVFQRYPFAKSPDTELRYCLFGAKRQYRLVYEIDGDCVIVHDIQACRQDTDKSLV
ncbi:MAG: hypothetical protein LBN42_00715 [Oscillospiraceae bacterium]|jgi:hypothetical protein|nr:hypothetical protein [Oscillospiraceae bacterium]